MKEIQCFFENTCHSNPIKMIIMKIKLIENQYAESFKFFFQNKFKSSIRTQVLRFFNSELTLSLRMNKV